MLKHRASSQTFADLFYEAHFNTCLLHKLLENGQFNHTMASKDYVLMNSDYIICNEELLFYYYELIKLILQILLGMQWNTDICKSQIVMERFFSQIYI